MHGARRASIACAAFAAGAFLAAHHPVAPWLALVAFVSWCVVATRVPGAWPFVLPACLPAMNFAPWTGWIVVDEFDLVVLGALAGGYAARAPPPLRHTTRIVATACAAAAALSLVLGWRAGESPAFGCCDGYTSALNALRVQKSLLYVLLLLPLLRHEVAVSAEATMKRLAAGMLAGLAVVVAAATWERVVYPGPFDFSDAYRTVALFWEMHVGGAAIDAYLALAMPFAAWAVLSATTPRRWAAAAAFALLAEYVCLTTFSRGVYLAVAGGALVLVVLWRRDVAPLVGPPWRARAARVLLAAVVIEGVVVVGAGSFMTDRIKRGPDDFATRLAHWRHGVQLLQGPAPWVFGKGAGRLPAEYATAVAGHEFSGEARLVGDGPQRHLRLLGPAHNELLGGLYALTQRVGASADDGYRAEFVARVAQPTRLAVSVCRMHLLYEDICERGIVHLVPGDWRRVTVPLTGPALHAGHWGTPRTAVFALSVLDAGGVVELDDVVLRAAARADLLRNGDFSSELAHWFPAATHYFVPWHIDNLLLELLIEDGLVGVATFALLLTAALRSLLSPRNRGLPLRAVLVASLSGVLLIGLVSSVLDVPRVAFLLYLFAFLSIELGEARHASDAH